MDRNLFGNRHWYHQPEPIRPGQSVHATSQPIQRPGRRVVQIPVRFVGSESMDQSGSARKIQKVFRGFIIRKSLNKIRDIKAQVDEIEVRLQSDEVVKLIRSDKKEQLRMNEALMSLLLKLDSISGSDFGVRLCRKAVIRKAVALQDRIDSVVASADSSANTETVDQETEISVCPEAGLSSEEQDDLSMRSETTPENPGNMVDEKAPNLDEPMECWEMVTDEGRVESETEAIDVGVDVEFKLDDNENDMETEDIGKLEDNSSPVEIPKSVVEFGNGSDSDTQDVSNRELLERIMDDNKKVLRMMEQLCDKTESHMQMLNALTHRVELLENAFLCDRLIRNKKKKKAAARDII